MGPYRMTVESLHERAESQLSFIRDSMARARSFTAIPGWGGVGMGVVGLAAAVTAAGADDARGWLTIWLGAAAVAVPLGAVSLFLKARGAGLDLASGAGRRFVVSLAPPILSGAVLTLALAQSGAYRLLPAVWLLLYGTATVVGGAFSVRPVLLMGAGFMALGALAAFVPMALGNWLLGTGFGALQGVCGLVIVRRYGG